MELQTQKILDRATRMAARRLESASIHLVNRIRQNLSTAGTATAERAYVGAGRHYTVRPEGPAERDAVGVEGTKSYINAFGVAGKKYRKGRRIYGANPSQPGEFPHKQHGILRASIAYDVNAETLVARIGTPLRYGRHLEFGTRKMAPRPWLRRTLGEEKATIEQILQTGKAGE